MKCGQCGYVDNNKENFDFHMAHCEEFKPRFPYLEQKGPQRRITTEPNSHQLENLDPWFIKLRRRFNQLRKIEKAMIATILLLLVILLLVKVVF